MKRLGGLTSLLAVAVLAGCPAPDTVAGAGRPRAPAAAASPGAPVKEQGPPIPERFAAWLALYDEAGFPDVARLERIDRWSGSVESGDGSESSRGLRERVWVLRRKPALRLLDDSLWTADVAPDGASAPGPPSIPPVMRIAAPPCDDASCDPVKRRAQRKDIPGVEPAERPADFAAELERDLAEAERAAADPDERDRRSSFSGGRLGPPEVLWLVRARWAKARGRRDLAVRALAEAERILAEGCRAPCEPVARLREGFQQKLLWQAIDGLSAWMPRPEALALTRRARSIAPAGKLAPRADALLRALDQAVAEDQQHAPGAALAWGTLSFDQRAAALIFLLREQNGHQMSQPGACDPFDVGPGVRNPAQELVEMGRKVIPFLIPHVASAVPTRSVGFHRDFHFSHHALTVGDIALDVIERVSGRRFPAEGKTPAALRAEIAAWWSRAAGMSEKDVLIDALRSADEWERSRLAHQLLATAGMDAWDDLPRSAGSRATISGRTAPSQRTGRS